MTLAERIKQIARNYCQGTDGLRDLYALAAEVRALEAREEAATRYLRRVLEQPYDLVEAATRVTDALEVAEAELASYRAKEQVRLSARAHSVTPSRYGMPMSGGSWDEWETRRVAHDVYAPTVVAEPQDEQP